MKVKRIDKKIHICFFAGTKWGNTTENTYFATTMSNFYFHSIFKLRYEILEQDAKKLLKKFGCLKGGILHNKGILAEILCGILNQTHDNITLPNSFKLMSVVSILK